MLVSTATPAHSQNTPTTLSADRVQGVPDLGIQAYGDVVIEQGRVRLQAEQVDYNQITDTVKAVGSVELKRGNTLLRGVQADVELGRFVGEVQKPQYDFGPSKGHGKASLAILQGSEQTELTDATYTVCREVPGPSWLQDWFLSANRIEFDQAENQAYAYGAVLHFQGLPIFGLPVVGFPLSGTRRSGWLAPTAGYDSKDGFSLTQPYYWNIAPNRDLTLTPTLLAKRGLNIKTQARYLEPSYQGQLLVNVLPLDRLRDKITRWGVDFQHRAAIPIGITGLNPVALALNIQRVSDNNYWRDFTSGSLSNRLLSSQALLTWNQGLWKAKIDWQRWQVQQDVEAPVTAPFRKWPQIALEYTTTLDAGFDVSALGDFTRFRANQDSSTIIPDTNRGVLVAQLSYPWQGAAGFLTPRITAQARHYSLRASDLFSQRQSSRNTRSLVIPTLSLDSGLVFERHDLLFGKTVTQTLEPRVKIGYTPFRNQSDLPNFDSAAFSFDFSQAFNSNTFSGYDRTSDSKFVTVGVSSRVLSTITGQQWAQLGLAQRYLFQPQRVILPGGISLPKGFSNILGEAHIRWNQGWETGADLEYNQDTARLEQSTLKLRYAPSTHRVVDLSYSSQRNSSERYSLGWQWPLNDLWEREDRSLERSTGKWYTVGRLNHDSTDNRFTDGLLGFEYDGGCWTFRAAIQRQVIGQPKPVNQVLFQLELVDFVSIGKHPLGGLADYVPGYQNLR